MWRVSETQDEHHWSVVFAPYQSTPNNTNVLVLIHQLAQPRNWSPNLKVFYNVFSNSFILILPQQHHHSYYHRYRHQYHHYYIPRYHNHEEGGGGSSVGRALDSHADNPVSNCPFRTAHASKSKSIAARLRLSPQVMIYTWMIRNYAILMPVSNCPF